MRLAHAAMLFASRLLAAQLSNAWTQRSYPALWPAMLGAFLRFCQDSGKLTSRNRAAVGAQDLRGKNGNVVGQALRLPSSPSGRRVHPPYNFVDSNSAAPWYRR